MSDWSGWAEITVWGGKLWEPELTAFLVATSTSNMLKDLVTLSLALHTDSSFKYSFFFPPLSFLSQWKSRMRRSNCNGLTLNRLGYKWKVSPFCLHALCILNFYAWWKPTLLSRWVYHLPHWPFGYRDKLLFAFVNTYSFTGINTATTFQGLLSLPTLKHLQFLIFNATLALFLWCPLLVLHVPLWCWGVTWDSA